MADKPATRRTPVSTRSPAMTAADYFGTLAATAGGYPVGPALSGFLDRAVPPPPRAVTPATPAAPINIAPASAAAWAGTHDRIAAEIAHGNYLRAAGASLGGVPRQALAAAADLVGRPTLALVHGAGELIGGAIGSSGSETDAIKTPVVPAATPQTAVKQALAQGREAKDYVTPEDQIRAYIGSVLSRGATVEQAQALAGLAGAVPALSKPVVTNKDARIGVAGNVADAIYASALEAAKSLPAGEARDKAYQKATQSYWTQNAIAGGVNPQGLSTQQQIDQIKEGQ